MFKNKEKISPHQALMLILAGGIGNIFVILTGPAVKDAGRDGWLSVTIAYTLATLVGMIVISLGKRFPDKTLVQYLPSIIGKIPGKIVGLLYILGFWIMTPLILREILELVRFFLPRTPILVIAILMSILPVYSMKKGFEVSARTIELFSFTNVVLISVLIILVLKEVNFRNLLPIMENGFIPTIKALKTQFSFSMETILFMSLWLPLLNNRKTIKKITFIGMSISGILLTIVVIVNIAFAGETVLLKETFPVFSFIRHIFIGDFLSGFEALFMMIWVASSYLELLVFFYQPVVGLAQWLNLKDYKSLIIPMAIINVILALVPSNITETLKLDSLFGNFKLIIGIFIPIIWIIANIRKLDESKKVD